MFGLLVKTPGGSDGMFWSNSENDHGPCGSHRRHYSRVSEVEWAHMVNRQIIVRSYDYNDNNVKRRPGAQVRC